MAEEHGVRGSLFGDFVETGADEGMGFGGVA